MTVVTLPELGDGIDSATRRRDLRQTRRHDRDRTRRSSASRPTRPSSSCRHRGGHGRAGAGGRRRRRPHRPGHAHDRCERRSRSRRTSGAGRRPGPADPMLRATPTDGRSRRIGARPKPRQPRTAPATSRTDPSRRHRARREARRPRRAPTAAPAAEARAPSPGTPAARCDRRSAVGAPARARERGVRSTTSRRSVGSDRVTAARAYEAFKASRSRALRRRRPSAAGGRCRSPSPTSPVGRDRASRRCRRSDARPPRTWRGAWVEIPHVTHHDEADITDARGAAQALRARVQGGRRQPHLDGDPAERAGRAR